MSWVYGDAGWEDDPDATPIYDQLFRETHPEPSVSLLRAGVARTAVEVLADGGILRPAEVVDLAAAAGLDLAAAATMLIKESGGGRNVWGSDAVNTGGAYVKGSEVTRASYTAYLAAVRAGRAGRQGVGPCQLTWSGYQDQADQIGGCWDWRSNVIVGFRVLAAGIKANGLRAGFRAYNGSGPAAERYADAAVALHRTWQARLAGATTPQEDDMATVPQGEWNAVRDALLAKQKPWGGGISDIPINNLDDLRAAEEYDLRQYLNRNNVEIHQAIVALGRVTDELTSLRDDVSALKAKYGA